MADVTKEIALEVSLKDSTSTGTQSAKQRLREMQKELIAMAEAGQQGTDAFKRLEQQAGRLKDEIADVNQRVKNLASDTKRIDAFVGAVQGIAAGFQIAQGAAALFGDENEDLQKAMLKVQGAMALANGVQQVANLLQKESAVMMGINTAATNLYTVAVGTATGAMRAFRIALLATGIGAAVAAIGLLIAKWDELTAAVRRFLDLPDPKEEAAKQAQALKDQEAQLNRYRNAYEEHTDKLIAADKKREEQRKKAAEAERQRLQKLRDDNKAFIAFMEETNLLLYEEELDSQARKERSLEAAMQREGARRKAQANNELEGQKKRLEDEKFIQDQKVKLASDGFSAIGELANAFAGSSEESQKRAFNINKAAGIAQTIIDTFAAAQGAYKSQMTVPDPSAPIRASVAASIAIAQGLARVAAISKTQFKSTSTATPPPTPSGASSSTPAPTFINPQTTNLGTGELSAGQGQGMQPMRAYVVERDIQQTTSRVRRLSEFATLG
jgi:chromosome segregation ATPase